jgi:hypothetical protein
VARNARVASSLQYIGLGLWVRGENHGRVGLSHSKFGFNVSMLLGGFGQRNRSLKPGGGQCVIVLNDAASFPGQINVDGLHSS